MERVAKLASRNQHKLRELRAALPDWELDLLDAGEYPPEEGPGYVDNARGKARFARTLAPEDAWVLGEDSGIEVNGLDGRPRGLYDQRECADHCRQHGSLPGKDKL